MVLTDCQNPFCAFCTGFVWNGTRQVGGNSVNTDKHDREPVNRPLAQTLRAHSAADSHDAEPALNPPKKLYRISEIAEHIGLTRQTIHNYATIGLITEEMRTPGGQRLFDESVFSRLGLIRRLKSTHRLREIRRLLEERAPGAAESRPGREGSTS